MYIQKCGKNVNCFLARWARGIKKRGLRALEVRLENYLTHYYWSSLGVSPKTTELRWGETMGFASVLGTVIGKY